MNEAANEKLASLCPRQPTAFLGGLPSATSQSDIRNWLVKEGFDFCSVAVLDRPGQRSCAFIRCNTAADVEAIIARFDGAPIGGRKIRASVAEDRTQQRQARTSESPAESV